MKKWIFGLIAVGVVTAAVFAGTPFRETVSVVSGTGTYTYPTDGIVKPYGEAIKITAILTPSTAGTTNTIKMVDGTITNTVATKVSAANDSDTVLTDWWHFAGEKVIITSTDTNTFTAVIVGEEE